MTRIYVESFVETCMDMGLSKEAAAELLQRRSAVLVAENSPSFAEGYLSEKSRLPRTVMVRPGYVEKRAGANLSALFKHIGGAGGAIRNMLSNAGLRVTTTMMRHPTASKALIGGGLAAGGGFALNSYLNNRYRGNAPFLPGTGSYNPEIEKQEFSNQLDRYSAGIAETNKAINDTADRRRVLQQAVNANSPHSAQALAELNMLNARVGDATTTRTNFMNQLNSAGADVSGKLQNITARQQQLRERKQSPFWRGLHWATFRNPDKSYDAALNELQGPAAELSRQNQLIQGQQARLPYYEGHKYNQPSATQMQREFFPTT